MMLFASFAEGGPRPVESKIDDALIVGVGQGDRQSFTLLYEQSKNAVYAFALSLVHDPTDAEDIMQDTYLHIRSAAHLYRPDGKPMAWILTITKNLCYMKFRQQKHLSLRQVEEIPQESDFGQIEDLEDRLVLKTALRVLSEQECQIVLLHAVTGWKHRQIGAMLELPLSTVLSKYHRGLKKLRAELEGMR